MICNYTNVQKKENGDTILEIFLLNNIFFVYLYRNKNIRYGTNIIHNYEIRTKRNL